MFQSCTLRAAIRHLLSSGAAPAPLQLIPTAFAPPLTPTRTHTHFVRSTGSLMFKLTLLPPAPCNHPLALLDSLTHSPLKPAAVMSSNPSPDMQHMYMWIKQVQAVTLHRVRLVWPSLGMLVAACDVTKGTEPKWLRFHCPLNCAKRKSSQIRI